MTEIFSIPLGLFVVYAIRLLVPLTIFRWPLMGALASFIVDALDTTIGRLFGVSIPDYTLTDKYLDTYYLTIELIVSLRWFNKLARNTSIFLYVWRLVGLIAFKITGLQYLLVFAPNLFEHFFLFYVFLRKIGKETKEKVWLNSLKRLVVVLLILLVLKIPQELVVHVWKIGSPVPTFLEWFKNL